MRGFGFTLKEFKEQLVNFLRSALIGLGIGILPGLGGSTSNLLAYSSAKSHSKYPEKFGTGIIDGVVATETSNNASVGGAMVASGCYSMVINMMATKETWPFFILGFVLAAIPQLTLIALGLIGISLALIYLGLKDLAKQGGGMGGGSGDPLGDILNDYE